MAGDQRSHQMRAGVMQGYNCFLCFHFPPLQVAMNKVILPNDKRLQGVCVCVLVLSPQQHTDWQGTRVTEKLSFVGSGITQKQRVVAGTGLLLLLGAPAVSLLWAGKQRLSGNEVTTYNLHPTGSQLIFRFERAERVLLCAIWGEGSVMFSEMICSWCCLVSYVDLCPVLRFLLLVCSGCRKKTLPENNEQLLYLVLQSMVQIFCSLPCLQLSLDSD